MISKVQSLREQNEILRRKIEQIQSQRLNSGNMDAEIKKFIDQSEKNIGDMTEKVTQQNTQMSKRLQELTSKYEGILKNQIGLLTKNKQLSQKKEQQDQHFNDRVEKMTATYESKIKDFETKVKGNVRKIKDMSETNVIKKLLKSQKFKTQMKNRGIRIQVLEKQSELEDIIAAVEEKETQIAEMQVKSEGLDEELTKMRQLIETMKQLLENMVKQKQNIVKQNIILKQKLKQSEQLIGKLLGGVPADGQQGSGEYEQDFENEEQQVQGQGQGEGEGDGQGEGGEQDKGQNGK